LLKQSSAVEQFTIKMIVKTSIPFLFIFFVNLSSVFGINKPIVLKVGRLGKPNPPIDIVNSSLIANIGQDPNPSFVNINTSANLPTNIAQDGSNVDPYRHSLELNPKYKLAWEVDWRSFRVTFNVTAQTRGYVGFGLSRKGKMCKLGYSNLIRYN